MRTLYLALTTVVLGHGLVCAPAIADDDDNNITPIMTCGAIITEPGKYQLANDLTDCSEPLLFGILRNGVSIFGNDVILDLGGHMIRCAELEPSDGTISVGVFLEGGEGYGNRVRVTNGVIENCGTGMFSVGSTDSRFEELTIRDGGIGIDLGSGFSNRVRKNHIYGMQLFGIQVRNNFGPAVGHRITKNLVHDAGIAGISSFGNTDLRIKCNRADSNGNTGISVGPDSTGVEVRNNVANENMQAGILLGGNHYGPYPGSPTPSGNTVNGNTAVGNFYDLAEASVDLWDPNFALTLFPDAVCSNTWKGNRYVTELAPLDCIAPPRPIDDDDGDDGCAPGFDDDDDDDDDD
ncbi:MAG: right-handed parallel beta-helix repeat-containing protein [Rhodothermales bacterium]|nr:right-handed parallel beta-helix repeat-containing protein [Rhodothermales bacterium]